MPAAVYTTALFCSVLCVCDVRVGEIALSVAVVPMRFVLVAAMYTHTHPLSPLFNPL